MASAQELDPSPVIDCRGLQCPAPILRLAEAARRYRGSAASLTVLATDEDFPVDLEAWCRTTRASLVRLEHEQDGLIRAQIHLGAAPPSPTMLSPQGPAERDAQPSPRARTSSEPPGRLDLTGMSAVAAMRKVNEASIAAAGRSLTVISDAPGFEGRLAAWTSATDTALEDVHRDGSKVTAVLRMAPDPAAAPPPIPRAAPVESAPPPAPSAPIPRAAPVGATLPTAVPPIPQALDLAPPPAPARPLSARSDSVERAPVKVAEAPAPAPLRPAEVVVPREDRAVLLVLHNDLEVLMSALMVAGASASQGMAVDVYFAFWGIHLLRGERPRPEAPESNRGILQRLLLWLLPRGPRRQRLGKLHLGGFGTRILLRLMRRRNILALDQLVESAVAQGVRFNVCSMSMGLMGLSRRDIVDLPNLSFAGVTSFAEAARRSAVSLVF